MFPGGANISPQLSPCQGTECHAFQQAVYAFPDIRVNQAPSPQKDGRKAVSGRRFSWKHMWATRASKRQRKAQRNREDCEEQIKASGHLALNKFMCRFSETEDGDGSSLTFAQTIRELPSQATPHILAFLSAVP